MNIDHGFAGRRTRGLPVWVAFFACTAWAGTFGTVVPIGGNASDLALDELRQMLYIANFSANRIEVMSTADLSIRTSMAVAAQPSSLALSPDGQFLVVTHFGNYQTPGSPANALTVINLYTNLKQTFALGSPPLGVAFGIDNLALVVTTSDFLLFDPVSGATQVLDTVAGVTAKTLPVPPDNFPPQIVAASVSASGDGLWVYGLTDTIRFGYDVQRKLVYSLGYTATPPLGPRTVSVSRDGSYYAAGWGLFNTRGRLMAQFRNPSGALNIGSHAIDSNGGTIYAQIPEPGAQQASSSSSNPSSPPVLMVLDADNLTVRERLQLPENLAGKSVLSAAGDTMYSISDSGVVVMRVGTLAQAARVAASQEDVVFRGNFCDRRVLFQDIAIVNPGGGRTDFRLSASAPGISISPSSGVTPAVVRVSVDPSTYQNQKGTSLALIQITSNAAVNLPAPIRVLINNREPDQRGTMVNVPGKLVDLLADPVRDRFYILRQDTNQVLVFDGSNQRQIATLRTGNTPTQMAITFDRRYLLVGHDNSQFAYVFDLETLEPQPPICFPPGHYPRSLAASGRTILAASRVAGPMHTIDRVDWFSKTATELPTLGVFTNSVHINTTLVASPNGSSVLGVMPDGNVLLYNANVDTFTIYKKPFASLSGAYAASSYDVFAVDNYVLNSSLGTIGRLESGTGASSGFAFVDQFAFRTTAPGSAAPGVIQRTTLNDLGSIRPTRMAEAPLLGETGSAFTRTLAPLYSRNAIVSLSISGFTVLSWNYDAAVAPPRIQRIVSAADYTEHLAPGGLVSLMGSDLSPVNMATREIPLPTALGESCLTVNGLPVPLLFVSPSQINAQLPFQVDGKATLLLRTPGGVSDSYNVTIQPAAPAVFRSGIAGPDTGLPTVVRLSNQLLATLSNPIHRGDDVVIYLTGMGRTNPAVGDGVPSPSEPLAQTLIQPTVSLGGTALPIYYSGLAPGQVGVYQINVHVPYAVPLGMQVPLTVSQGSDSTALPMRVVD